MNNCRAIAKIVQRFIYETRKLQMQYFFAFQNVGGVIALIPQLFHIWNSLITHTVVGFLQGIFMCQDSTKTTCITVTHAFTARLIGIKVNIVGPMFGWGPREPRSLTQLGPNLNLLPPLPLPASSRCRQSLANISSSATPRCRYTDELLPLWLASPHPAELPYWKKCGVKIRAAQGY